MEEIRRKDEYELSQKKKEADLKRIEEENKRIEQELEEKKMKMKEEEEIKQQQLKEEEENNTKAETDTPIDNSNDKPADLNDISVDKTDNVEVNEIKYVSDDAKHNNNNTETNNTETENNGKSDSVKSVEYDVNKEEEK